VNTISGYGPTAGARLAMHPDIDKIGFTGSTAVGHFIEKAAAESNLKRVSLELGGKSPVIICDDADLETALTASHIGLFLNAGQCCCAGTRIYVQSGIYDEFVRAATERAKAIKLGGYHEPGAVQGPQVDDIQFRKVLGYIEKGKAEGAQLTCGGGRYGHRGYFVEPTVFSGVTDNMTIAREEIFGPVMPILKWDTDDEIVRRANDSMFGLAAGVFSKDAARALGIANQLRAGTVWVNTYDNFDVMAPFGGYKQSGHGRDKGEDALDNWLEIKCITMPLAGNKS
jgi:aldehyde dehydrogenase (NAD+)